MAGGFGSGALAAAAIRRPVTTIMTFAALALLGVISWRSLPVQLMPTFAEPRVYVQVIMPGASPEAVERDALRALEGEIAGIGGVEELSATATPGEGTITVAFRRDVDLDFAFLRVQQRVAAARDELPIQSWVDVQRFDTSQFRNFVMALSLRGDSDLATLRELADDVIVPELSGVDGVVQVLPIGGASKQVGIFVDPGLARGSGVSVTDVQAALASASRPVEAVGHVEDRARRLPVVLDGRPKRLADITQVPVGPNARVRLGNVSRVEPGIAGFTQRYRVNGQSSVALYVYKDQQSNLIRVAQRLRERVEAFNGEHAAERLSLHADFDAAERMEEDLDELVDRALAGMALALVVLLIFLRDVRTVLVVGIAMPVSLLLGCALFKAAGLTLNVLSLLGLALSVGMLLDNAIVVLEAISARRERGDSPLEAARRGAAQVQRAVLASTLTTLVVFVPLWFVETEASPLFEELALSVSFPLIASLAVAVTLVPVVASRLRKPRHAASALRLPGPNGLPRPDAARSLYSAVLRAALRKPLLASAALMGVVVLSVVFGAPLVVVFVDQQEPEEDRIEMVAELAQGSTDESVDAVALQLEALAQELPEIDELRTGIRDEETSVTVVFRDREKRTKPLNVDRARERLRSQVKAVRGARVEVDPPPPGADGGGQGPLGGGGTWEVVRVLGPGGPELQDLARRVEDLLEQVPGLAEVRSDVEKSRPTLEIRPDREKLAAHGMSAAQLMSVVWATRREGEPTRHPFRLGDEDVDLVLWVEGGSDRSLDDVRAFPLITSTGARVALSEVASVTTGSEPPTLRRHERQRAMTLRYSFTREAAASAELARSARADVDAAVASLALPPGHAVEVEHATEELGPARRMIYLGLVLVFFVLAISFESLTHPLLVMLCVPLASVGVIWALVLTGTGFSPLVPLALVVLLGVVVNHGILFVDRMQQLQAQGAQRPSAVLRAAQERLRPILMTTATTCVGLLPLAVGADADSQLWPPFARAFMGGLLASTLISLVFIPAGALLFGGLGDLLRKLGPVIAVLATAAWVLGSWLVYFQWRIVEGELLRWLLAPPAWLLCLGVARALQAWARGERPPEIVGEGAVSLEIRNARKIYGGLPRVARDYCRVERWKDLARRAGLTASELESRDEALRALPWQLGALSLLGYLEWVATSTWGRFMLLLVVLALVPSLARTARALLRIAPGEPRRKLVARAWPAAAALASWTALLLLRREHSAADVVTLVLAGVVLGSWAVLHVIGLGGPWGLLRRKLAPQPVTALAGVTLRFEDGLYGLLGPNGAGKSTLMRLIVNVFRATRGTVSVNGHEVTAHAASLQPRIGYLPQFFGVPPRLSARQYLHHQALLAGQTERPARAALVESVLEQVGLQDRADEPLGGYSGGMRQRVGIARTLLNVPRIVVVDEPTVGLDPRERIRFRNLLAELARTRIVLLSTHVVEDIGSACREVVVLDGGEVLFRGTPTSLVERAEGRAWTADVVEAELASFSSRHRVVASNRIGPGLVRVRGVGPLPPGAEAVQPSMEDAYLLLLGRSAREALDAA